MTDQELAQMINRVWADLPQEDKDPDPSTKTLLCVLFREWGRRDQDEAFAKLWKLSDGWYKQFAPGQEIQHAPGLPLFYAIWAGYGESDPAAAWEKLGKKGAASGDSLIFPTDHSPEMQAVIDRIFAKLLTQSPELATESVESDHRFRYVAMRTLLANMDDAAERLAQYYRWIPETMKEAFSDPFSEDFQPHLITYALTGIAMRDPEQAWHVLPTSGDPLIFMGPWINYQPEQAVLFLESKLREANREDWLFKFGETLLHTHPELAVQYLTIAGPQVLDPFGPPDLPKIHSQWPVVEGMKPGIPIEELQERWRKALDDHSAPPAILEMFNPLLKATD